MSYERENKVTKITKFWYARDIWESSNFHKTVARTRAALPRMLCCGSHLDVIIFLNSLGTISVSIFQTILYGSVENASRNAANILFGIVFQLIPLPRLI